MEIDHEIVSKAILSSTDSRRVVVSYKQKYVHRVLVLKSLSQACPGKSVIRCTDHPNMTIAVDWDVKNQTKQNNRILAYMLIVWNQIVRPHCLL